jgi:protein TonB
MNRFHIISALLHVVFIGILLLAGQGSMRPLPKVNVYKVSIAPLPQPKVIPVEEPVTEEKTEIPEKPPEKKAPPEQTQKPKETPKPKEPAEKKVVKKGLPDISPKIYTGSGRGFTYSYYLNILLNKINGSWHNPFKGKDIVLRSIVYFEVDKNGRINNVRLEENSGNQVYNESTIRAVTLAKKLPPLPQEFSDDYLKVHLEFLTGQ